MLDIEDLFLFYKVNSIMIQQNIMTLTEIESLMPFEKEIYVDLYIERMKKEQE